MRCRTKSHSQNQRERATPALNEPVHQPTSLPSPNDAATTTSTKQDHLNRFESARSSLTFGSPRRWIRTSWSRLGGLCVLLSLKNKSSHLGQAPPKPPSSSSSWVAASKASFVVALAATGGAVDPAEIPKLLLTPLSRHTESKPHAAKKKASDAATSRDRERQCKFSSSPNAERRCAMITVLAQRCDPSRVTSVAIFVV